MNPFADVLLEVSIHCETCDIPCPEAGSSKACGDCGGETCWSCLRGDVCAECAERTLDEEAAMFSDFRWAGWA